jgi:hypothetical protein
MAAFPLLGDITESITIIAINKTQVVRFDWLIISSPFQSIWGNLLAIFYDILMGPPHEAMYLLSPRP